MSDYDDDFEDYADDFVSEGLADTAKAKASPVKRTAWAKKPSSSSSPSSTATKPKQRNPAPAAASSTATKLKQRNPAPAAASSSKKKIAKPKKQPSSYSSSSTSSASPRKATPSKSRQRKNELPEMTLLNFDDSADPKTYRFSPRSAKSLFHAGVMPREMQHFTSEMAIAKFPDIKDAPELITMAIKHYEGKRVNKLKQCRRFRKDLVAAEKKHREAESEDAQHKDHHNTHNTEDERLRHLHKHKQKQLSRTLANQIHDFEAQKKIKASDAKRKKRDAERDSRASQEAKIREEKTAAREDKRRKAAAKASKERVELAREKRLRMKIREANHKKQLRAVQEAKKAEFERAAFARTMKIENAREEARKKAWKAQKLRARREREQADHLAEEREVADMNRRVASEQRAEKHERILKAKNDRDRAELRNRLLKIRWKEMRYKETTIKHAEEQKKEHLRREMAAADKQESVRRQARAAEAQRVEMRAKEHARVKRVEAKMREREEAKGKIEAFSSESTERAMSELMQWVSRRFLQREKSVDVDVLGKKAASLGLHDLDLDAIAHAAGDPGHSSSRASLGLSSSPRKRSGRAHSPSSFAREGRVVGWEEKSAETEVDRRLRQMQREDEEEFTHMYGSLDPWQHPELLNNEPTLLDNTRSRGGGDDGGGEHSTYRFGGRVGPKTSKRRRGKSAKRADELFDRSKQNPYSPYYYEREELTGGTFAAHQSAQRVRLENHKRQEAQLPLSMGRALKSGHNSFVNTSSSVHSIAQGSPIRDRRGEHSGAILNDVSTDEDDDAGFTRMNGGLGPLSDDQIEQLLSELSARLNEKLMLLIRGELRSEEKRHALLASLTDPRERDQVEESFRKERLVANRRIEQVTAQNETIVSQKMEELGIPRPRE